jgi:hypothetical protein
VQDGNTSTVLAGTGACAGSRKDAAELRGEGRGTRRSASSLVGSQLRYQCYASPRWMSSRLGNQRFEVDATCSQIQVLDMGIEITKARHPRFWSLSGYYVDRWRRAVVATV